MKKLFYLLLLVSMTSVVLAYLMVFSGLPSEKKILEYKPETTVVNLINFNWDREIIVLVRKYIPLKMISKELRKAVVISEDDLFFQHSGINMNEVKKAFEENLEKKRFARGASTITMQLARNAFLFKKKTITRKLKEIIIAKRIEKYLDKRTILEYYLNVIEWGPNIYGAEAAAYYYFDKSASKLNLAEASLLAAILPNPIYYNPFTNLRGARRKQSRVLKLMKDSHLITSAKMKQIMNDSIYLRGQKPSIKDLIQKLDMSSFDSMLRNPRMPDSLKIKADSTGIIYLPEGRK